MQYDVIIIGAGVLGVSLGFHLSNSNLRVLIIEREAMPAVHASGKNAGMIRQLYHHPQLTSWANRSIKDFPKTLRKNAFKQTGSVVAGRTVPNHHQEVFEQQTIRHNNQEIPAVYSKDDGLLDSPYYVTGLFQLTNKENVSYKFNTEVTRLERHQDQWEVYTNRRDKLQAPIIVNAAGAWINRFLKESHPNVCLPTDAYARHLFVVHGWEKDFMPVSNCGFFWDEAHEWYMRRWDPETRLVSICDETPANPETFIPNPTINEQVATKLLDAVPQASTALRLGRSWHCFRTYTEDQLPVWGFDQNIPGLFWLAAFGGFGMSTSYAATKDAAETLLGKAINMPSDLLPKRYQQHFPRERDSSI